MRFPSTGLFSRPDSRQAIRGQMDALKREVDNAPGEHVQQVDVEAWADALVDKYVIRVPELRRDEMVQDPPKLVTVRYDASSWDVAISGRRMVEAPGTRYRIRVPFDGEGDVFAIAPSTRTLMVLKGQVKGQTLSWEQEQLESVPFDLGAAVQMWLGDVQRHLDWWADDVRTMREQLRSVALHQIQARKAHVQRIQDQTVASGIPIAGQGTKTFIPQAIVRRPGKPQRRPSTSQDIALVPELGDQLYEQIIESLRSATAREQSLRRREPTRQARDSILRSPSRSRIRGASLGRADDHRIIARPQGPCPNQNRDRGRAGS